jgi:ATP-dependent protease ClpP protease subunit
MEEEMQIPGMIIPKQKAAIIQTPYHSLYVIKNPERYEQIDIDLTYVDDDGQEIQNPTRETPQIFEKKPESNEYILYFGDFMAEGNENHILLAELLKADYNSPLSIFVSSDGGSHFEFLEFYNTIKPKFNDIRTYLHTGYSAGSMAFLLGDYRYVYEHSDLMVHSYTAVSYGKRDDLLTHIHHQDRAISNFFKKIYSPYFTKKELKKIDKGEDFWLGPKEMLKRGIATHIITDNNETLDYKEYKEFLKKRKKEKKEK